VTDKGVIAMSKKMRKVLGLVVAGAAMLTLTSGCAADTSDDGDDGADEGSVESEIATLRPGVNSAGCRRSAYNCGLNAGNGQRVYTTDGGESWGVDPKWVADHKLGGVPVVDGNGERMGISKNTSFTLNHGQTRRIGNVTYVMALSSGLSSAGWVPIDSFVHADSIRAKVGEVNAKGDNLKDMGCYEVGTTFDPKLDTFKVVKGAKENESKEPNDYLPMKRANGKVYVNLAFSVPGDALGAPAVDIFPAGTKFQRLDVPTWEGTAPSLDAKLYAKPAGSNAYTVLSKQKMKFIYGYVKTAPGSVRYGWMAIDGLKVSGACPNR
jgi:hypothetical protein